MMGMSDQVPCLRASDGRLPVICAAAAPAEICCVGPLSRVVVDLCVHERALRGRDREAIAMPRSGEI
jgi:hypothetical protein